VYASFISSRAYSSQAEQAGCKRIKKLELVTAGLKEQVAALAISKQRVVEEAARAEARATSAEAAERELRGAVENIKHDFEVRQKLGFGVRHVSWAAVHNQRKLVSHISPPNNRATDWNSSAEPALLSALWPPADLSKFPSFITFPPMLGTSSVREQGHPNLPVQDAYVGCCMAVVSSCRDMFGKFLWLSVAFSLKI